MRSIIAKLIDSDVLYQLDGRSFNEGTVRLKLKAQLVPNRLPSYT